MPATALQAPVFKARKAPLLALVALVVALAAAGGALALSVLQADKQPVALPDGPFGLSQDIPVSFGALGVENVTKTPGVSGKSLASATHGIQNLIPPSKVRVQASVTLTNLLQHPVNYSPRSQFRLIAGNGRPIRPFSSSVRPGTLQPAAAIDAEVSFIVPKNGQKLWLTFQDPGRAKPVRVDLGRVGPRTPDSAFDKFHGRH